MATSSRAGNSRRNSAPLDELSPWSTPEDILVSHGAQAVRERIVRVDGEGLDRKSCPDSELPDHARHVDPLDLDKVRILEVDLAADVRVVDEAVARRRRIVVRVRRKLPNVASLAQQGARIVERVVDVELRNLRDLLPGEVPAFILPTPPELLARR